VIIKYTKQKKQPVGWLLMWK